MKRRNLLLCAIAALMFIPLSATWAVWEGNAGIAAASEFPGSGMYAKSDMFPKNTIVEIQNLETGSVVRAVITGSSGVPGLVAVLSPDAAAALNIASGSVSRVRISTPSPVAEKPAAGTVAAANGNENRDPDVNPAVAAETAAPVNLETVTTAPADPLVPLAAVAPVAVAGTPAAASETPVSAPEITAKDESSDTESSPAEAAPEVAATEPAAPVAAVVTATEVAPEASESAAVVPADSAEPEVPTAPATVSVSDEVPPVTESTSSSVVYDEPAIAAVEPAPASADESEVTLVTASENPPVAVPAAETAEMPEAVPVAEPVAPAPVAVETPVPTVPVAEVEPVPAAPVAPVVETKKPETVMAKPAVKTVPAASDVPIAATLAKGIYVQIASYSEAANVRKLIDAYGKKYPLSIERGSGKSGEVMKVLIGPVKKDEYGAVLERFKQLGFKDAFVKKVQ
jgi:cell division septation protein DedD